MNHITKIRETKNVTQLYALLSEARKFEFISPKILRKVEREGQYALARIQQKKKLK